MTDLDMLYLKFYCQGESDDDHESLLPDLHGVTTLLNEEIDICNFSGLL